MPSDFQEPQADASPIEAAPAPQQGQPAIGKGGVKGRNETMQQAIIKRTIALEMLNDGKPLHEIAKALGYARKSKVVQLLERGGIKISRRVLNQCAAKRADDTEGDPATLTEAQLERAVILGITPGRFAHLLTCEHGTSPLSHPLPGNAYTRNTL